MWVAVVLHTWTAVVQRMLLAVFDISVMCVVVLIIPTLICVIVSFLNFSQPGEENVEVHVDLSQWVALLMVVAVLMLLHRLPLTVQTFCISRIP